jgi:hypothetical protein
MMVVGEPVNVPFTVLVVIALTFVLPKNVLNGVGVDPPVRVPPDEMVSVAAAEDPPEIFETYIVTPLPPGLVTCRSKFCPPATEVDPDVTTYNTPAFAALPSGLDSTAGKR